MTVTEDRLSIKIPVVCSKLCSRFDVMPGSQSFKNVPASDAFFAWADLKFCHARPDLRYPAPTWVRALCCPRKADSQATSGVMALPRSEEQPSELQSLMRTSYAVFCLTKKTNKIQIM